MLDKIKADLKAFLGDRVLWHFADDFGTALAAGIPALAVYLTVPADGNWKAAIGAFILAFLGIAYPAFRRAWAENKDAVIPAVAKDAGIDYVSTYALLDQFHSLVDLAETVKEKYPSQYETLIAQASTLLDQIIARLPEPK